MPRRETKAGATFQIGELATRSGVTADTLRYYERLGLLPRAHRTSGGFRTYTNQALDRLRFIKQARALGLTLQEIRTLATYHPSGGLKRCREVRDMLRSKITDLEARIAELQAFRLTLAQSLDECEQTLGRRDGPLGDSSCPVINTLSTRTR